MHTKHNQHLVEDPAQTYVSVTVRRRLEWVDTDESGRWHFSNAFRLFESAESSLWEALGGKWQLGDLPRVSVQTDFHSSLYYMDLIDVRLAVVKVGTSSLKYQYQIFRQDELCAGGEVTVVSLDPQTGKPIAIPAHVKEKLETTGHLIEEPLGIYSEKIPS